MKARSIDVSGPIEARVRPPGSKSITNRALLIAALAEGTSQIGGALESDDTWAMRDALVQLGVSIRSEDGVWRITGCRGRLGHTDSVLDVRASGTTARFLTAALTLARGRHTIDGVARMRERPIGELAAALRQLGGLVETAAGFPPVVVTGSGLRGGEVVVDASRSSQFASAVMLVAPYAEDEVIIRFKDDLVVSRPYLDTTAETMRAFGARAAIETDSVIVAGGHPYEGTTFFVEPDASAASYPLVAAAVTGGSVEIEGLPGTSSQADMGILTVLESMGCRVVRRADSVRLHGPVHGKLRGVETDMNDMPDAVLAVAVAAVFADGPTTIVNVASLRLKETDRLAALQQELRKLGVRADTGGDWLRIVPTAELRGSDIATYDDHRMAMAFALAGLRIPGVRIENPECVSKTWPGFFEMLDGLRVPVP